jgi:hypothetical protein
MTEDTVAIEFMGRQLDRVITEISSLRDDMTVLTAIVMRMDGTMTGLLTETRAVHSQISRIAERVRKIEEVRP